MRLPIATGALAVLAWIAAHGQEPQSVPPPGFQTSVNYVQVDVSVLDRERKPVTGLRREDFVVFEDGKVQTLLAFSEIAIQTNRTTPAPWSNTVLPDEESNSFDNRRLVILLIDDAQIRPGRMEVRTKAIAKQIVESLAPDDLAAVTFTRTVGGGQAFTSSKARLLAAVDGFRAGNQGAPIADPDTDPPDPPMSAGGLDSYFQKNAVNALSALVNSAASTPERRKALIYLSPGWPIRFDQQSGDTDVLNETFRAAQRGNVNIYPVDPAGLGGVDDFGAAGSSQPVASGSSFNLNQDFLRTIAANTSGFAVTNLEAFGDQVRNIFTENSSYYLLGYETASTRKDRGLRKIEVRVSRPDVVVVRSRTGYFPPGRNAASVKKPDAAGLSAGLSAAVTSTLPVTGLRMQMTAAPFGLSGTRDGVVVMSVGVTDPVSASAAAGPDQLDMFVAAVESNGKARATDHQQVTTAVGQPLRERVFRLRLPPGKYQLRAAAESRARARAGSVFLDVEIPDFARRTVSISGIAFHIARPDLPPSQTLDGPAPNLPSSSRRFSRADRLRAIVRIYQGGAGQPQRLAARVRLTNEKGAVIHESEEPLPAECFAKDRSCELPFTLPGATFSPGAYLLTIETALAGENMRRDAAFTIF